MRYLNTAAAGLMYLALSTAAWGEIYETTDAQGNPEFTNSPPASNAKKIEIQQTNTMGAPEVGPQSQMQQPAIRPENQQPQKSNNTVIIDDPDTNAVYQRAETKQREFERMNPEAPRQVMNAEAPDQVGDFPGEMPTEVNGSPSDIEEVYDPSKHRSIHHKR